MKRSIYDLETLPREEQTRLVKQNKQYSQEIGAKPVNRQGLAFSIQSTHDQFGSRLHQNDFQTRQMIQRQEQQDHRQFMMQSVANKVQLTLENQPENENQQKIEKQQIFTLRSANLEKPKENYQQYSQIYETTKKVTQNIQGREFSDIQQVALEIQGDLRRTEEFLLQNLKSTRPLEGLYHQQFSAALQNLAETIEQFGKSAPETADSCGNLDPYYEMLRSGQQTCYKNHISAQATPQLLTSGVPRESKNLESIGLELAAQLEADLSEGRQTKQTPGNFLPAPVRASMPRTSYEPVASIAELVRPVKEADLHLSSPPEPPKALKQEQRQPVLAMAPQKVFKTGMAEQKPAKIGLPESHRPVLRQPADKLTVNDLEDHGDNESDPIMDLALQLNDLEERSRIAKGRRNIFLIDK